MGENKALIRWKGKPFIEHMQDILASMQLHSIIISGTVQGYCSIEDTRAHQGPVSGIYTVAQHIKDTIKNLVVVPIDMPLLTPDLIERLIRAQKSTHASFYSNYPLPCCLSITPETLKALEQGGSMYRLLTTISHQKLPIPTDKQHCFSNINTKQDLQLLDEI